MNRQMFLYMATGLFFAISGGTGCSPKNPTALDPGPSEPTYRRVTIWLIADDNDTHSITIDDRIYEYVGAGDADLIINELADNIRGFIPEYLIRTGGGSAGAWISIEAPENENRFSLDTINLELRDFE